ncbi:MAG: type I methionyl aminopeptidase [Pseudomonadales bacterium]|nr:type I methionyl aminopeptidase [Pseudomonadales bacterium]
MGKSGTVIQNSQQHDNMRIAGRLAAQVLDMIEEHVQPGVTTDTLDKLCHDYIVEELGCIPAPLNYGGGGSQMPFPKSICTSVNHVICHGIPTDKKKLKNGDVLNIDITVIKEGFYGDTSKMFCVGETSVLAKRLLKVTQECLYLAIEQVRPGAKLGDIGSAIQAHAEKNRFSIVREFCGHGIGTVFHGDPQVVHYGKSDSGMTLTPGMCFTIEPMINAGKRHIKILPDEWTAVTKDHKLSAQWEHTVMVTQTGVEVFTLRAEETPTWKV